MRKVLVIVFLVILLDQALKFYIKTNYALGDETVIFSWFRIHFLENPGMAYGLSFGGNLGKYLLSILRIILIGGIFYFVAQQSKKQANNFLLIPFALILGGAIGNMLDSAFYGLIFNSGTVYHEDVGQWFGYPGVSKADFSGYSSLLQGCVVDMLYFPLFEFNWPQWVPVVGGKHFSFFDPIFNLADSAITVGIVILLLFRNKAFKKS